MMFFYLIFNLIMVPLVHSCDVDACRIGTSVGTGVCGIAAGVGGAFTVSTLCATTGWFTFGLSCVAGAVVWAGVGASCAGVGAAVGSSCNLCASEEAPDSVDSFEGIVDSLDGIELSQVEDQIEQKEWFHELANNDKNLLLGQGKIIALQEMTLDQLDQLTWKTDQLIDEVEKAQIVVLYGDDLIRIGNVVNKFKRLTRGKHNIVENDIRAQFFRDAALHSVDGLESSIDNIFLMMLGGHILKSESIYSLGSNYNGHQTEYCKPAVHKYFLNLQVEALMVYSIALAMEGHTVSPQVSMSFNENVVKATSAFVQNCGCPHGFQKSNRGFVSGLLSKFPESSQTLIQNYRKLIKIENRVVSAKVGLLLEVKNVDISSSVPSCNYKCSVLDILEEHSVEDIALIVEKVKQQQEDDLKLHNFADICVDKERNSELGPGFCCYNSCQGLCGEDFYQSKDTCKTFSNENSCNPRQCAPWCGGSGSYHKCAGKAAPHCALN